MFGFSFNNQTTSEWKYDDLETPQNIGDYKKLIENTFKKGNDWLNDNTNWQFIKEDRGIVLEELPIANSSIGAIKTTANIKGIELKKLVEVVFDLPLEEKKKLMSDILAYNTIKEITDDIAVCHSQYATPFGISNREFVFVKALRQLNDNKYMMMVQSINYEDKPFTQGYVRGVSVCCNYIEKLDDGSVKFVTIDHVDPRGMIPAFVINAFKDKAIEKVIKIQEVYAL